MLFIMVTVFLSFSARNLLKMALFCHASKIVDLCDSVFGNKRKGYSRKNLEELNLLLENHNTSNVVTMPKFQTLMQF